MKSLGTKLPEDLYNKLHEFAKQTGLKIWFIVAEALRKYLSKKQ